MGTELTLALALAVAIGLSLGVMGSGGSIVTLPVLVYVAGIPAQTAVAMTMVIVGATSLLGSYLHYRHGHFHTKATLLLGLTGMVGAYFGSSLTGLVSQPVLMLAFAALMLAVGSTMLRQRPEFLQGERCYAARCLTIGAGVGVLTGFLGVGGGFLIVPVLVILAGIEMKKAVAASLAIIGLNSVSGLIGQLRYAQFDWTLTAAFLALALVGMGAGAVLVNRLSEQSVRRTFAWCVIGVALVIGGVNLV